MTIPTIVPFNKLPEDDRTALLSKVQQFDSRCTKEQFLRAEHHGSMGQTQAYGIVYSVDGDEVRIGVGINMPAYRI